MEFEVVLANSTVVKATPIINPDLFWALRGGGNNFGIVTNVVIEAFKDPPTWYTFQLFNMSDIATVFDRLEKHTTSMPPHVWQIATTLQWHVPTLSYVISERMVASELPDLPKSVPRMNQEGMWEDSPILQTNFYQRSILAMAEKMDTMNPKGFFNFFGSITIRSDADVSMAFAEIFKEETESIKNEIDLQIYIVYNPLTQNALHQMKQRGGNALGLSEDDGPLTVVNINLHWSNEKSEPRMRQYMRNLINRFRESARARGKLHPYLFQNHAFEEQDVFAGSGESKLARLREIRKAVDPDGVFQKLQPGFFKLEPRLSEIELEKSEL
ncbi:hypothetical protein N0V90_005854 [Kalmusia sp. IMI 367209]|nr:hypothetical protein N0V90_005854 [Kalmusia sp. IMI 367209]